MRYTTLGNTGLRVSVLGFGCMRLPEKDGKVNRDLSTPLLIRAVELGINFFDTATMYCNSDSQAAIGDAFKGMRDKVILSTKNPLYNVPASEWRKQLENSLTMLQTDYIDVYNHHGINWGTFTNCLDPEKDGLTKEMIKAKQEGLIKHIGFSFHDSADNLPKLVDTGYYESVILQYNLLDQFNDSAMRYAGSKGMGIIVMGPVGGGRLGINTDRFMELLGRSAGSVPEAAIRFVLGHPSVDIVLSGMQNLKMLEDNVSYVNNTTAFTNEEIASLNALIRERKEKSGLYCTACRYCTPACKKNINIPDMLDLLNLANIYGLADSARDRHKWFNPKVSECIECNACSAKCPQKIDIAVRMKQVKELVGV